jgi:hypothetical protein
MEKFCKCGCGLPALKGQRARYADGHFKVVVSLKKRLRIMRDWAKRRGIDFSLAIDDLRSWLVKDHEFLRGIHLERIDKNRGFESGNLKVKNLKALTRHVAEITADDEQEELSETDPS